MSYRVGFVMDQIAGHVTNYRNLRSAAEREGDLDPTWHEIHYYKAGGAIEQVRERLLPFVSTYVSGIMRGTVEVHRALRKHRYDALFSNASVGVFFSRAYRSTPTMIDFDSTPRQIDRMEGYAGPADPAPVAHLKWRLTREMLHSATLLQAWSNWAKQSAVEEYGVPEERVIVNPPGVNLQFWRPGPAQPERPLRVLFVGADFRRKGGELLLDWWERRQVRDCELHIVTREPVEPRPGVFVYRTMRPNTDELLGLYQQSDLFVLPSLGECFGIATVEAMAAGLAVIASDVGGTADIIEPMRNGLIVPGNDRASLFAAIDSILGDAALRQRMGVQSRLMAEERFDLHKNARRTFDHLRRIARQPEPKGLALDNMRMS